MTSLGLRSAHKKGGKKYNREREGEGERERERERVIYLFIEGLQPSQPHTVTSGLFTKSNLTQVEYNTEHAHVKNTTHINIIRKLVPSALLP